MSIKNASTEWKTALGKDPFNEVRFYIDPRRVEYAPISGTETYYQHTSTDAVSGEYSLSQSNSVYMLPFTNPVISSVTFEIMFKPMFAYDVGTDQFIWMYRSGSSEVTYLSFYYNHGLHRLGAYFHLDNSTILAVRTGETYSSDSQLQQWIRLTCVCTPINMTVYSNGANAGTVSITSAQWNAALHMELLRPSNNVLGYINYGIHYNGFAATAAQVESGFYNVPNEQILFTFNKVGLGRTRCDITKQVISYSHEYTDGYKAATMGLEIKNIDGRFSADQYATYMPESASYNGTSDQAYLANNKIGITYEQWSRPIGGSFYSTTDAAFEIPFYGVINNGAFSRTTNADGIPTISISAEDEIVMIAERKVNKARFWESYYFSRATPASNSLLHEYVGLANKREIYNYLGNSGFENTTIGNSWIDSGTGASFIRSNTYALNGTYSGYLTGTSGLYIQQEVLIDVSAGQKFTFQIYARGPAQNIILTISEYTDATLNGTGRSTIAIDAGWNKLSYTYTATNYASNKIAVSASIATSGVYFDMAMLSYGGDKTFYTENTNDGSAGVISSTLAKLGSYDLIGIDAEDVAYIHTWATISQGESPWDNIKALCDASICRLLHIYSGLIRYRSYTTSDTETVSRGVLPKGNSITNVRQPITANKVTVKGVIIVRCVGRNAMQCVFHSDSCEALMDYSQSEGVFWYDIPPSTRFPPIADYPDGFELVYQEPDYIETTNYGG